MSSIPSLKLEGSGVCTVSVSEIPYIERPSVRAVLPLGNEIQDAFVSVVSPNRTFDAAPKNMLLCAIPEDIVPVQTDPDSSVSCSV